MGKRKLTFLEKVLLVNGGVRGNRLRKDYKIKPMKRRGKED